MVLYVYEGLYEWCMKEKINETLKCIKAMFKYYLEDKQFFKNFEN
jgi:hypothetical protein